MLVASGAEGFVRGAAHHAVGGRAPHAAGTERRTPTDRGKHGREQRDRVDRKRVREFVDVRADDDSGVVCGRGEVAGDDPHRHVTDREAVEPTLRVATHPQPFGIEHPRADLDDAIAPYAFPTMRSATQPARYAAPASRASPHTAVVEASTASMTWASLVRSCTRIHRSASSAGGGPATTEMYSSASSSCWTRPRSRGDRTVDGPVMSRPCREPFESGTDVGEDEREPLGSAVLPVVADLGDAAVLHH